LDQRDQRFYPKGIATLVGRLGIVHQDGIASAGQPARDLDCLSDRR
jgi:hypothetical protein